MCYMGAPCLPRRRAGHHASSLQPGRRREPPADLNFEEARLPGLGPPQAAFDLWCGASGGQRGQPVPPTWCSELGVREARWKYSMERGGGATGWTVWLARMVVRLRARMVPPSRTPTVRAPRPRGAAVARGAARPLVPAAVGAGAQRSLPARPMMRAEPNARKGPYVPHGAEVQAPSESAISPCCCVRQFLLLLGGAGQAVLCKGSTLRLALVCSASGSALVCSALVWSGLVWSGLLCLEPRKWAGLTSPHPPSLRKSKWRWRGKAPCLAPYGPGQPGG